MSRLVRVVSLDYKNQLFIWTGFVTRSQALAWIKARHGHIPPFYHLTRIKDNDAIKRRYSK